MASRRADYENHTVRLVTWFGGSLISFAVAAGWKVMRNAFTHHAEAITRAPDMSQLTPEAMAKLCPHYGDTAYVKASGTLHSATPLVTQDDVGQLTLALYVSQNISNVLCHQKTQREMEEEAVQIRRAEQDAAKARGVAAASPTSNPYVTPIEKKTLNKTQQETVCPRRFCHAFRPSAAIRCQ